MSTAIPLLIVVALVAAVAFCAVAIWAALEVAKTARTSRRLVEDIDTRVVPLAEKADVTVDALNAELLRLDMIIGQVEGAVDKFSDTAETVREVVDAPIHLVSEVAERFRKGFRRRGHHHERGVDPQHDAAGEGAIVVLTDRAIDAANEPAADAPTSGAPADDASADWTAADPTPEDESQSSETDQASEPDVWSSEPEEA